MATTKVPYYGVHWAAGRIAFLHQSRGATNAVGIREPSPFEVRTPGRKMCNHLIQLNAINSARSHLDLFQTLIERNELVRFMLPIPLDNSPSSGVFYSNDIEQDLLLLTLLMKMSSPIRLPVMWANLTTPAAVVAELGMTNVQPLILAGAKVEHTAMVRDLCREAKQSPRRLLVMAHPDVPLPGAITGDHLFGLDEIDLAALPWESLGALVLRAYMRSEWAGTWFTREPTPGNEAKPSYERTAT